MSKSGSPVCGTGTRQQGPLAFVCRGGYVFEACGVNTVWGVAHAILNTDRTGNEYESGY